jgi:hypothetical protein
MITTKFKFSESQKNQIIEDFNNKRFVIEDNMLDCDFISCKDCILYNEFECLVTTEPISTKRNTKQLFSIVPEYFL